MATTAYTGARVFYGISVEPATLVVEDGSVRAILPAGTSLPPGGDEVNLSGGIIAPGFVDLQVNGGGGLMLNDAPDVGTLTRMADAHAGLGTLALFPTLITDRPEIMRATVDAVASATGQGVPGIAGLHLEGPHLSLARKGAHDPALIRPLAADDLAFLVSAARRVPRLMVTLAPEAADTQAIAALSEAGVIVSLGHTDCGFATARAAFEAGAGVVTHLFNAMSQLQNREPGLVGAAMSDARVSAGLIADGVHVHPAAMRIALDAKQGSDAIFLVTDAMAPAGTTVASFALNGRTIRRENGRLTLPDGTLAGADLDFPRALRVLTRDVGVPLDRALAMATRIPAQVGRIADSFGTLAPGRRADFVHLDDGLHLRAVWRGGETVGLSPGLSPL